MSISERIASSRRLALLTCVLATCLAVTVPLSTASADVATGNFGVHMLVDTDEFPAVRCVYPDTQSPPDTFKVRPPIMFAVDRTSGIDAQTMGWRFKVSGRNLSTEPFTDVFASPVTKATGTDRANATFTQGVYHRPSGVVWEEWRVVYDLRWYYPTASQQDGRVTLKANWYLQKVPDQPGSPPEGSCLTLV